jgi:hypothetical protein
MKGTFCVLTVLGMVAAGVADPWDNGDDTGSGATILNISTTPQVHAGHTLSNNVDDVQDWFRFSFTAGKRYRIYSTGPDDVGAQLYSDSSGSTLVDENEKSGDGLNFQIIYTPSSSGPYYLKVRDLIASPVSSAAYDLHYFEEPVLDPWDSDDDVSSNATLLAVGTDVQTNGLHNLSAADVHDWFRFIMLVGSEYTLETAGGWDTSASLYNDNLGLLLNTADDFDIDDGGDELNFKIVYTPTNTGVFYLQVRAYNLGDDINYDLNYQTDYIPDSDGDGFNDVEEFTAGTATNDAASFFTVTNGLAGGFIIEWSSIADRLYSVQWTTNLSFGYQTIKSGIEHPQGSYTDTVYSAEDTGYYKVNVELK